jgi:Family of unknown function (DUF6493)
MTRGDLKAILEAGDVEACIAYFEHATEQERKAVAAQALEWYALQDKNWYVADGPTSGRTNPLLGAADAAVLASCSLGQLKKRGRNLRMSDTDFRVLAARKPDWITDYAGWSLEKLPAIWPAVRRLERAGLCRRPDTDHYVLGLIQCVAPWGVMPSVHEALLSDPELLEREVWHLFEVEGSGEFSLAAYDKYSRDEATWETALVSLAADGTLPRDRLLDASLAALERDFAQFRAGWFSRFHEALQPTLDERAERVELYLNLLASKIPPTVSFALSALSKLDRAQRLPAGKLVNRISPALTARSKGAVSTALKLLENAARRDPALKRAAAMVAAQALSHESPDAQSEAFDLVVRAGARDDTALLASIVSQLEQLAASVQPRVREWLGSANAATPPGPSSTAPLEADLEALMTRAAAMTPHFRERAGVDAAVAAIRAGSFDVPAISFDGTEFPRLDPAAEIQPIAGLDELIGVFSAVLENPDAIDEVERVLDGVSRLCGHRPSDFEAHTRPLFKRATALLERHSAGDQYGPFTGWQPAIDLCGLALSWIGAQAIDPDVALRVNKQHSKFELPMIDYQHKIGKWSGLARVYELDQSAEMLFLSRRALAVARRAAKGQAEPLLSAPTHRGGWIDPIVLVDRIQTGAKTATTPEVYDQVQAILRLAPGRRAQARRRKFAAEGEFAQAVRYALGGDTDSIGPTAALWIAAARARAPFDDDPRVLERHPNLGPDAGAAARFAYRVKLKPTGHGKTWAHFLLDREPAVPPEVPSELPTVRLHCLCTERDSATIRWGATIWPIAREAWLAQGVDAIGTNLDWWEAHWGDRTYLEPLTDPDLAMKPMALLLLTLGLAAKEAGEHGLATDGLIAAIDDGRIDGPLLGGAMRSLLPTKLIIPSRWAKTLRDAARVSPSHARVVARALEHALGEELVEPPRDMLALLELLKELLIELGESISLTAARVWLAGWKAAGKSAKVVKDLLALTGSGDPVMRRDAALRALAHRIERAERWSRNR